MSVSNNLLYFTTLYNLLTEVPSYWIDGVETPGGAIGSYQWNSDGIPITSATYENWAPSQPNASEETTEYCVAMTEDQLQ